MMGGDESGDALRAMNGKGGDGCAVSVDERECIGDERYVSAETRRALLLTS